jgi:hypothetical protein
MTRTEAVARAVAAELERRRGWLDSIEGLRSVTVVVKMNAATGGVRAVIVSMEAEASAP